jgi:hypothetical protein
MASDHGVKGLFRTFVSNYTHPTTGIWVVGQTSTFACAIYVFACHIAILALSFVPNSCEI